MIEATLFLETTPDRFIQRLADYARESRCQVIKHPDGLILAPPGHQISTAEIPPRKYGSLNIVFVVHDLAANRVEVEARPGQPAYEPYFRHLLEKIEGWWPPAGAGPEQHVTRAAATEPPPRAARKPGRRPLEVSDPQGFLYRMIQAQSAEALKDLDPEKTWQEIAREIGWKYGSNERGIAALRRARNRLKELEIDDPQGWLSRIKEWREANEATETIIS